MTSAALRVGRTLRAGLTSGRRLAREHWLLTSLLVGGLTLRVLASVAYRPALIYIDSAAVYLRSKLSANSADPLGYNIFLLKPLLFVGNLPAVTAVQHLLGLGMAVVGYALLVHKGVWRSLAALAMAPVLLDAYQVQIEQNIMSDTLFQTLLVVGFAVLLWPRQPSWRRILLASLLLGMATLVRQVGEPLLLVVVVYVLVTVRPWRRSLALGAAAALAFAVPIGTYMAVLDHSTGRYALASSGGHALYGRVAPFADCTGVSMPEYERSLCPTQPRSQRPGPDFWSHAPNSPQQDVAVPDGQNRDDVLTDFSVRIIKHQPGDFITSIASDAAHLFALTHGDFNKDAPVQRWQFQTTFPQFLPLVSLDEIEALGDKYGGGPPTVNLPIASVLRFYQLHGGYTSGPPLALALLAALAAVVGVTRRARRSIMQAPALVYLSASVAVLLFADTFEFTWRYQLPSLVLIPMAGALGIAALVRRPPAAAFPEPADTAAIAVFDREYARPDLAPVVVLIAAYNEAHALGPVLDAVPRRCQGLDTATLVVVDGATDATAAIAREHGAYVCEIPVNRGQGAALRLGYHLARRGGARFIVTTDADGQYDITELPALLAPLLADQADFVTGSRTLGANESTDRMRRAGTRFFAALVTLLTRHKITDTSFGLRAMRAEVTESVPLHQPQYQSSELLVGALARGFRVIERPMTMRQRTGGRSKKGNNLVYGLRYTGVVLGTWARDRPGRTVRAGRSAAAAHVHRADRSAGAAGEHEAIQQRELQQEHDAVGAEVGGLDH